jgi:hypothetical protein
MKVTVAIDALRVNKMPGKPLMSSIYMRAPRAQALAKKIWRRDFGSENLTRSVPTFALRRAMRPNEAAVQFRTRSFTRDLPKLALLIAPITGFISDQGTD